MKFRIKTPALALLLLGAALLGPAAAHAQKPDTSREQECALLLLRKNEKLMAIAEELGPLTPQSVGRLPSFGLSAQERVDLAKILAKDHRPGRHEALSPLIGCFGIADEKDRAEVAKFAAPSADETPPGQRHWLSYYDLTSEETRIDVAKAIVSRRGGNDVAARLREYGITDKAALTEIALISAAHYYGVSQHIRDFGITNEATRVRIAHLTAADQPDALPGVIQDFEIASEATRIEIARHVYFESTLDHKNTDRPFRDFRNFRISDPALRLQFALKAATHRAWSGEAISAYDLSASDRFMVAKAALIHNPLKALRSLRHYGIEDKTALHRLIRASLSTDSRWATMDPSLAAASIDAAASLLEPAQEAALRLQALKLPQGRGMLRIWLQQDLQGRGAPLRTDTLMGLATSLLGAAGVPPKRTARLLWGSTRRQDVISFLFLELVQGLHENGTLNLPEDADSLTLWMESLGLAPSAEARSSLAAWPEGRRGELMALGIDLARRHPRPLAGVPLPPSWFAPAARHDLLLFFNHLRDVASLSQMTTEHWHQAALQAAQGASLPAAIEALQAIFVENLRELFSDPRLAVGYDDLERLEGRWGDLSPIMTLLARFHGRDSWKKEIPTLGRVFQTVLHGDFESYKFTGFPGDGGDHAHAEDQVGFLSEDARGTWMARKSRLEHWDGRAAAAETGAEDRQQQMMRRLAELLNTNVYRHIAAAFLSVPILPELPADVREAMATAITTAREAPAVTLDRLVEDHGLSNVIYVLYGVIARKHPADMARAARFLQALGSRLGEPHGPQLQADGIEMLSIMQSADRGTKRPAEALIFTTSFTDPKLLLTIGDLVQAASCQNYRTGSRIETLLGYVVDANVQGLASWVVSPAAFSQRDAFAEIKRRLAAGERPELELDGGRLTLTIRFDGAAYVTKPLGHAHMRRVLKLGRLGGADSTVPALFLERAYLQPHDAGPRMKRAMDAIAGEYAGAMGAVLRDSDGRGADRGPIHVAQSRNPGGVYSDAAGGGKTGAYVIP